MVDEVPSFNDVMRKHAESSRREEDSDEECVAVERTFVNFLKFKLYGDERQVHSPRNTAEEETPSFLTYLRNMINRIDPSKHP